MATFSTTLSITPAAGKALPFDDFDKVFQNTLALKQGDVGLDKLFVNDTSNAFNTTGITINQGAADNEIASFKSSDVAHGMTTITETDTYAAIMKVGPNDGGLFLRALTETGIAFAVEANATTEDATRSTAGVAHAVIAAWTKSGTTSAAPAADKNIVVFRAGSNTKFIFDSDGDSHEDGTGWTAYDDHDDLAVIEAVEFELTMESGNPIDRHFSQWLTDARPMLEQLKLVTFNENGHHFVNRSRMQQLLCGAVRQLGRELFEVRQQVRALEEAA